ncbi:MAG: exonuclease subunit SbcD [Deltaproteobacteria bacterium]|nr:exonuclease subunit SbcD [Deltaproteobacteria bacterium]
MKILHTSDWHLGQNFMSKTRRKEHESFLKWLRELIDEENIDVLLVSGDIFDTGNPPNYALELYYNFLKEISKSSIKSIVITAGNHDSVSNIEAPKELLKLLNINVKGTIDAEYPGDNLIEVSHNGQIQCYICAVPFIKERDVRFSIAGESYEKRNKAYSRGFKKYYNDICSLAAKKRRDNKVPIIGMGHTFAAGCNTSEGEREIFIGNLGKITANSFPEEFDYIALGHLHNPQKATDNELIRYSGSPISLSFSESSYDKQIILIDFKDYPDDVEIESKKVPEFQKLLRLKGDKNSVLSSLKELNDNVWVEVNLINSVPDTAFLEEIREIEKENSFDILAVKKSDMNSYLVKHGEKDVQTLYDLTPNDVFDKRITNLEDGEKELLKDAFNEVLMRVNHENS